MGDLSKLAGNIFCRDIGSDSELPSESDLAILPLRSRVSRGLSAELDRRPSRDDWRSAGAKVTLDHFVMVRIHARQLVEYQQLATVKSRAGKFGLPVACHFWGERVAVKTHFSSGIPPFTPPFNPLYSERVRLIHKRRRARLRQPVLASSIPVGFDILTRC